MKILQVVPHFYPAWSFGGIARVVYEISRELTKRGHDVTVHTTNVFSQKTNFKVDKDEYYVEGIRVKYYRNLGWFGGLNFSLDAFQPSAKRDIEATDIINMHGFRTFQNVVAYYYAQRHGTPYVLTGHGTIPRVVERIMLKRIYDDLFGYRVLIGASKLVASGNIELKQYVNMGISSEKVAIIPNGINTEFIENLPQEGVFRSEFGIDDRLALILYVGRVHRRKGIGFLLDAFSQLRDINAVLVIAGSDDGYMSVLKRKASRLGITGKLVLTGFLPEKAKLAAYVDSEVVVYPGIYESFPIVPLEAALCSKPVIVSDDSVMGEIVTQGGFGLSTKYADTAQLRNCLLRILNNPGTADEMGRKGREFVKRNYNWRDIVSKLEIVYSNVLAKNRQNNTTSHEA